MIFSRLDICITYFCYCSFRKCLKAAVLVSCYILSRFCRTILLDLIYIFRCKCSVKPVECGWYVVVLSRLNPSKLTLSDSHNRLVSVLINVGTPYLVIQTVNTARASHPTWTPVIGNASRYLVYLLTLLIIQLSTTRRKWSCKNQEARERNVD